MLGPSGSGKTTCLRLIAGFEQPSAGHIEIFGETAEGVPPYRRNVNTVFQDYALFPHLNVRDNVAFSLMLKKVPKAERHKQAEARVGYGAAWRLWRAASGAALRRPAATRGAGARHRQQAEGAAARRAAGGHWTSSLRESMQEELKSLQKALGITFIFVTHDQGEALSMADRVAVFNDGRVQRSGRPRRSTNVRCPASLPTSSARRTSSALNSFTGSPANADGRRCAPKPSK